MKKLKVILSLSVVSLAVPFLCAFESAPSLPFVSSAYSGHEEITRQALNNSIQRLREFDISGLLSTSDFTADLGPTPKGLFGYSSQNMLVHGNFATDFPNQARVLNLSDFWNIPSFGYAENPKSQVFHFLRNYKNSVTVASARETCYQSREAIKYATQEAVKAWRAGERTKALFLMGHVTHIIQDSFSTAHTHRLNAQNNYNLADVCFYGNDMGRKINDPSGRNQPTCFHAATDGRDAIWNITDEQRKVTASEWPHEGSIQCDKASGYPETEDQKRNCLKHEARLARLATEKYLYLVMSHLNSPNPKDMPTFLASLDSRLFEGPVGRADLDVKMAQGIMRCEGLSTVEISGADYSENSGG
jgi:hypothetical protein